jgi:signal transduction histidine kinase
MEPEPSEQPIRILLVEDDAAQARLLREILSEPDGARFNVTRVAQATEAETTLGANRFDLVLLDLSLPDSVGLDTLRRIQATSPKIPMVVLTGLDNEGLGIEAVRHGAQDYLVKGQTDRRQLVRSIRYGLERHRVEEELARYRDGLEELIAQRTAALAQTNEALQEQVSERVRAEKALASALRKLATDRERQRLRLASELHDSVGQELIALKFALEHIHANGKSCLNDDTAKALRGSIDRTVNLIREVRAICHGLYPPTLEAFGLASALKHLAENCQTAKPVEVRSPESLEGIRFPGEVEIALFRIAQEALQNALRHSQATTITVSLAYDEGIASLSVVDNGIGFEPDRVTGKGLGFTSMRERAMTAGGALGISSKPGESRIEVRVPTSTRPTPPTS